LEWGGGGAAAAAESLGGGGGEQRHGSLCGGVDDALVEVYRTVLWFCVMLSLVVPPNFPFVPCDHNHQDPKI
jgi:hypothetical protein